MSRDVIDLKLLNMVQAEFPLTRKPYAELGHLLGIGGDEVINRIKQLKAEGLIREISPVVDGRRLGHQPTLVAMKVPQQDLARAEEVISVHPGVSHGYERDHNLNVWFTLSLLPGDNINQELARLTSGLNVDLAFGLPAIKVFKIGAYFDVGGEGHAKQKVSANSRGTLPAKVEISTNERLMIMELQQDLPLISTPFADIAMRLDMEEEALLTGCRKLIQCGIIRRFGASINHRKAGFEGNGMVCWAVPSELVDTAGQKLAALPEVSHCYERETNPDWQYNIFAMIHGRTRETCRQIADQASENIGLGEYEVLFSTREFKKVRVKYLA